MAASQAVLGYGTLLQRGNVSTPDGFTTLAEVVKLDGPKMKKDKKEVTHMESPGGYKEYIGALKDGGEVTISVNFIPSDGTHDQTTGVIADYEGDIRRYWKIVWPTDPSYSATFLAEVMDIGFKDPIDDALQMDLTLQLTGAPSWA